MATTVNTTTGLSTASLSADTVVQYDLPAWTRSVLVSVAAGGADVEWSWSGTDAAASFTSGYSLIPGGGAQGGDLPPMGNGDSPRIFVRPRSASATTVSVLCSQWGA